MNFHLYFCLGVIDYLRHSFDYVEVNYITDPDLLFFNTTLSALIFR